MKPTRYYCATPRRPRRDSNPHDASKGLVGKRASLHRPLERCPVHPRTLRPPHFTQPFAANRARGCFREASSCAPFLTVPAFSFSVARPLAGALVETDENRTRIFRVQTGRSPVELQPRAASDWRRCGYRGSHSDLELGTLVSCYWTMAACHGADAPEPPSGLAPESAVYETAARTTRAAGTLVPDAC